MSLSVTRARAEPGVPKPKRWSVEECYRLKAAGFLPGRYELIHGEILEKMGQNPPHTLALMLLAQWLTSVFGFLSVRQEKPISLPDINNEPEPDAVVTREEATVYRERHPGPEDVLLVVEVSDSTLAYDRTVKMALYAQYRIPEYWLLDIGGRRLLVYRQPGAEGYAEIQEFSETAMVSPLCRPEVSVSVAQFLPPSAPA